MHRYMLGAAQLESSFSEKNLGVLVNTKLNEPAVYICGKGQQPGGLH